MHEERPLHPGGPERRQRMVHPVERRDGKPAVPFLQPNASLAVLARNYERFHPARFGVAADFFEHGRIVAVPADVQDRLVFGNVRIRNPDRQHRKADRRVVDLVTGFERNLAVVNAALGVGRNAQAHHDLGGPVFLYPRQLRERKQHLRRDPVRLSPACRVRTVVGAKHFHLRPERRNAAAGPVASADETSGHPRYLHILRGADSDEHVHHLARRRDDREGVGQRSALRRKTVERHPRRIDAEKPELISGGQGFRLRRRFAAFIVLVAFPAVHERRPGRIHGIERNGHVLHFEFALRELRTELDRKFAGVLRQQKTDFCRGFRAVAVSEIHRLEMQTVSFAVFGLGGEDDPAPGVIRPVLDDPLPGGGKFHRHPSALGGILVGRRKDPRFRAVATFEGLPWRA